MMCSSIGSKVDFGPMMSVENEWPKIGSYKASNSSYVVA